MEKLATKLPLIPWPATVGADVTIAGPPVQEITWKGMKTDRLQRAVSTFLSDSAIQLTICCETRSASYPSIHADESYRLETDGKSVKLLASQEWGVLRGLATLAQLPPELGVNIDDEPRFTWRGLMIDVARHFISLKTLKRTLKAMAYYKLNVLHLHLCDDQAFRFPSQQFPLLNAEQPAYTRVELLELVELAAELGIRVIPEIDMPGHVNSWLVAYPEWGSGQAKSSARFGGHTACLDVTNPQTRKAIEVLLGEVMEVFPDQYLHIGGDEVNPAWWQESEEINDYMAQRGLTTTKALHAEFNQYLHAWLASKDKIMMGWDEVLGDGLPLPMTVQSWRGATARNRALAQGADCVVSANYYLDFWYPADLYYRFDPGAGEAELLAEEDALCLDSRLDHVKHGLELIIPWRKTMAVPPDACGQILGGEACLWSELVTDELVDSRLWGCMPGIAEKFWSAEQINDVADMRRRQLASWPSLGRVSEVQMLGVYENICQKLQIPAKQLPLLKLLEPTKWYARLLGEEVLNARLAGIEMPDVRPYTADMPLNKLVDYLPPESVAVWELESAVDAYIDNNSTNALKEFAQTWLQTEIHSDEELAHFGAKLNECGGLLLSILNGELPGNAESVLSEAGTPHGELLLAIVPVLRKLVAVLRE